MERRFTPGQVRTYAAFGLFFLTFLSLLATITGPGFGWDEIFYIGSGPSYIEWFSRIGTDSLQRDTIGEYWQVNHEHPPLAKILIGLAISFWRDSLGFIYAARMATVLVMSTLVVVVFLFMERHFDIKTGLFSAMTLLLMPRVFGHAHLAGLDLTMALMWFASTALFAEAVKGNIKWSIASGLATGAALLTKINALALPPILIAWGIFYYRKKALPACLSLLIGIPVFFAGWPWLWVDTFSHLQEFFETLSSKRTPIPVYYFGRSYGRGSTTPVHYPLVITLATLSVGTLVGLGVAIRIRLKDYRKNKIEILLAANAFLILLSASSPGVPKYDGVRLFLPAFPFIACLAGLGLSTIHDYLMKHLKDLRKVGAIWAAYLVWLIAGIAWMHPYYLSYYGGLAGGASGAHKIFGFESTYWGDVVDDQALDFVIENAPKRAGYVIVPHGRLALDNVLKMQLKEKRPDIREVDFDEAKWDIAVLNCRQGLFNDQAWNLYKQGKPAFVHKRQGVPLCMIFLKKDQLIDNDE